MGVVFKVIFHYYLSAWWEVGLICKYTIPISFGNVVAFREGGILRNWNIF